MVGENALKLNALSLELLAKLFVAIMGREEGAWRLTMDRTNWQLGRRDVNILMLGIVHRGIAIPLLWQLLDKKGNSNTAERISILSRFIALFGAGKIKSLLADRAFLGDGWLAWLQAEGIDFQIRIRNNIAIANTRARKIKGNDLFRDLRPGQSRVLRGARRLGAATGPKAQPVFVAATCLASGELLIVVTNAEPKEALANYALRWQIETLFSALKTRGFNLEDTHMTNQARISKLVAVLAIAFCWAHRTGEWLHQARPIGLKTHGRPAKSIFRAGFDQIRRGLFNCSDTIQALQPIHFLAAILTPTPPHISRLP